MFNFERFETYIHHGYKTPNQHTEMNEDGIVIANTIYGVIDGATSRNGSKINGMTMGAYITGYIHHGLTNLSLNPQYKDTDVGLLLAGANHAFGEHMKKEHPEVVADGFSFGPTASACFIRIHNDNTYSFAAVGDCSLVELGTEGHWFICPETNKPDEIENNRLTHFADFCQEHNCSFDEAWENEEVQKLYHDAKMLQNNQWPYIDGNPDMANMVFSGRRPLNDIAGLVLMTDGLMLPGFDNIEGSFMAAKQMFNHGVSAYASGVNKLYNDDPNRDKFMRFKHQDDGAAILIQFLPMSNN